MDFLDLHNVIFIYMVSSFIFLVFTAGLWKQARKHFGGIGFWLAKYGLQCAGMLLVVLRDRVPDLLSIAVGNTLIIAGTLALYMGLERFIGQRGRQIHNFILLGLSFLAYSYFSVIVINRDARGMFFALDLLVFFAQIAWFMLRRVPPALAWLTRGAGVIYLLYSLLGLLMVGYALTYPVQNEIFQDSNWEAFFYLNCYVLDMALAFNLFSMVNRRLMNDLHDDIAQRQWVEADLRNAHEQARRDAEEKQLLLREVNHRVKNNLASILALVNIEKNLTKQDDPKPAQQVLTDLGERIRNILMVHEQLSAARYEPLPAETLVHQTVQAALSHSPIRKQVTTEIQAMDPTRLWISAQRASDVAMAVNELVTNSAKYAYVGRSQGRIDIELCAVPGTDNLRLTYHDDGPGWPAKVLAGQGYNIGLSLIQSAAREQMVLSNDGGARIELIFRAAMVPDQQMPAA